MNNFQPIALYIAAYIMVMGSARGMGIGIFQNYQVHMINNIVNSTDELIVHCKSADDDLGEHFLDNGEDWGWKFKVNFFRSTLFFCDLQWGALQKRFAAFDTDIISGECEETSTCFWLVRVEGIYFSCDDKSYVKTHTWDTLS